MINNKEVDKLIDKIYIKNGYLANYGGDVLIAALIAFMAVSITSFIVMQSTMGQVRADWSLNRCKPLNIPFAGWIMPQPGLTGFEATAQNLEYCFQTDFSAFANLLLMPIQFIIFMIIVVIDGILALSSSVMDALEDLLKDLGIFWDEIYNLLLSFIVPFSVVFLHLRDASAKMSGVLATMFWTLVNTYNLTVSGIINIAVSTVKIMEIILLVPILLAIIIGFFELATGIALLTNPFTAVFGVILSTQAWYFLAALAAGLLAFYIDIFVKVVQLQTFIDQTFNTGSSKPTDAPSTAFKKKKKKKKKKK